MMKKLLIFMLVLCMASMANAVLVISVAGDPDPIDSEIWLTPSEHITLDIHAVGGDTGVAEGWPGGIGYFALVADTSLGVIDPYTTVVGAMPPVPDATMALGYAVADNFMGGIPAGYEGLAGTVGSYATMPPYLDGIYFDLIDFHCVAEGDVEILLMEVDMMTWATTGVIYDSVIIHQIPEPMTVLLLGLGVLFLRRLK
jgi:hypothetical protein